MTSVLSLSTLRSVIRRAWQAEQDLHNVARAMLQPGVMVMYRKSGETVYSARVVEVTGTPGRTRVLVEKSGGKRLGISLTEITGLVQEG